MYYKVKTVAGRFASLLTFTCRLISNRFVIVVHRACTITKVELITVEMTCVLPCTGQQG